MNEVRGVVLEIRGQDAVVLSQDGQFIRMRSTPGMVVGAEVDASTVDLSHRRRGRSVRRTTWVRYAASGLAACLAMTAGLWYTNTSERTAYAVSIDINPSVSLELDSRLLVKKEDGLNADGKSVLKHLDLTGVPLDKAVQELVNEAAKEGLLPANDTILISAAPLSSHTSVSEVEAVAKKGVQAAIQQNPKATELHPNVVSVSVSKSVWNAASQANISPGKFAAYLIAANEGKHVSLNELQGQTLNSILNSPQGTQLESVLTSQSQNQLEAWLQSITSQLNNSLTAGGFPGDDGAAANGTANNTSTGKGTPNNSSSNVDSGKGNGNGPGNHHPPSKSGKNQDHSKHGNTQNSVTVHIGNTVIQIPIQAPVNIPGAPNGLWGGQSGSHQDAGNFINSVFNSVNGMWVPATDEHGNPFNTISSYHSGYDNHHMDDHHNEDANHNHNG